MSSDTTLGPYTKFEIPDTLTVTFQNADGSAIDLSGFSSEAHWFIRGQTPADTVEIFVCSLNDGPNGLVDVAWSTAPEVFLEIGVHEMQVFSGDGTNRHASEIFSFMVRSSVATSAPGV